MPQPERLIILENTSEEAITAPWDGHEYTFPAGKQVTLIYGVGLHFAEHNAALKVVGEKQGIAPHVVHSEVTLLNAGTSAIDLMWDGHPYHLEPAATAKLDPDIAQALIIQARKDGGKLVLEGASEPETPAASEVPPHEPATAEQVRADEPVAVEPTEPVEESTPKKKRSKKHAE